MPIGCTFSIRRHSWRSSTDRVRSAGWKRSRSHRGVRWRPSVCAAACRLWASARDRRPKPDGLSTQAIWDSGLRFTFIASAAPCEQIQRSLGRSRYVLDTDPGIGSTQSGLVCPVGRLGAHGGFGAGTQRRGECDAWFTNPSGIRPIHNGARRLRDWDGRRDVGERLQ